jgi:hypothetical protein
MTSNVHPEPPQSPLRADTDAKLPAAAYLRYEQRADGWSAGRQVAFLSHLADNGVVADAARCVGKALSGGYELRRQARGYAFDLGWEAALIIARRVVADNVMTAAIKGEQSRWVREDGVTTFTRQNTKLSLTLLDRINPATALSEVLAVATRFDCFLQMIEDGLGPQELWDYFFDVALPHSDMEARARVRAALLLSEDSAGFEGEEDDVDAPVEYKSIDGPVSCGQGFDSHGPQATAGQHTKARRKFQPATPAFHLSFPERDTVAEMKCASREQAFVSSCLRASSNIPLALHKPRPWAQNQIPPHSLS